MSDEGNQSLKNKIQKLVEEVTDSECTSSSM